MAEQQGQTPDEFAAAQAQLWTAGLTVDLASLVGMVQDPPIRKLGCWSWIRSMRWTTAPSWR